MAEKLCEKLRGKNVLVYFEMPGYQFTFETKILDYECTDDKATLYCSKSTEFTFDVNEISEDDEWDYVVNNLMYIAIV